MNRRISTAVVWSCLLSATALGQQPIAHPERLAGPWEVTDASGIDGVFLGLSTHARGTADEPVITGQSVSIGVYHRHSGDETWGYYSPSRSDAGDAACAFDGRRLHIRNDRIGLLLDVTFDAATERWTGAWLRDGQRREVVLERPHPPSHVAPSWFTGDWDGLPEASHPAQRTRLHVAQSSDLAFTVWMDRVVCCPSINVTGSGSHSNPLPPTRSRSRRPTAPACGIVIRRRGQRMDRRSSAPGLGLPDPAEVSTRPQTFVACRRTVVLVRRGPLDMVDDEDLHHRLLRHQLQAQLLLQRCHELRGFVCRR